MLRLATKGNKHHQDKSGIRETIETKIGQDQTVLITDQTLQVQTGIETKGPTHQIGMEDETKGRPTMTGKDLNLPIGAITETTIEITTIGDPCLRETGRAAIIAQTTIKGQIHQTDIRGQNHQDLHIDLITKPTTEEGPHLHINRTSPTKMEEQIKLY